MLQIALSFSGKKHEGARLPKRTSDSDLLITTPEEFIHDEETDNEDIDLPLSLPRQDSEDGETRQVFVKKEIWLGRRERDPARKRARLTRTPEKGFNGGYK